MIRQLFLGLTFIIVTCGNSLVSIDLGSEFMKIGIVKAGVPIDIVLNTESKRKTPMVVYLKDDERLFGDEALSRGMKSPQHAYSFLLDLLGKTTDNPVVQNYMKRFPHHTIEKDPVRGTVVFRHNDNTFYSVEELLAMQLQHAVKISKKHGESDVSKVIICVPPFFNQIEREAVLDVARIAGVQVIQLMNTNSAVALQYAVFRNIKMTEKPLIVLFATVGSQFTTATVVSYGLQKEKGSKDKASTVQVLGTGYDRNLGGFEIDLRLRDYLAQQFKQKYPKKSDIFKNRRAMAKLLKESVKVKTVLSANAEVFAQVETLHEDTDFRVKVTRDTMEELCKDIYPRFKEPFEDAISTSGISAIEIDQVVLFGAATRIPKIQEQIKKFTGAKELHHYINTDEAAAMGSAFKAATVSSTFRTKEIKLKDGNPFPFHVAFFKNIFDGEGNLSEQKLVDKELYYRNNGLPQKKAMTFTKFTEDFHFNISYGSMDFLSKEKLEEFGGFPIAMVKVLGVQDVFNQHHDKTSKGIKAHIVVNDSGMLAIDSVEAVFETIPQNKTEESGWLDSVSNFFTGKEETKEGDKEAATEDKTADNKEIADKTNDDKNATAKNSTDNTNTTKAAPEPEKPQIVKEELKLDVTPFGIPRLSAVEPSKEKLDALQKIDDEKILTAEARNKLESYVIDMKYLMTTEEYIGASTAEELEKIVAALREETDWIEEESWGEGYKVLNERLSKIEDYCNPVVVRVREMEGRAKHVADLKQAFNLTELFLKRMSNTSEEFRYHTVVEIDNLAKIMNDTKEWLSKTIKEQALLPGNVDPVLKLSDLETKQRAIERELYYLIRKPVPQWYKDKLKKMQDDLLKAAANATSSSNSTTTSETSSSESADKSSADNASANKASTDNESADKGSADKESTDKGSADKESADKKPADNADKDSGGDASQGGEAKKEEVEVGGSSEAEEVQSKEKTSATSDEAKSSDGKSSDKKEEL